MDKDVEHCIEMIAREEQSAAAAPSSEAAEMHYQMIMLYRAQLQRLEQFGRDDKVEPVRSAGATNAKR